MRSSRIRGLRRALALPALGLALCWSTARAQPPDGPPPGRPDGPPPGRTDGPPPRGGRFEPGQEGRPGPGGPPIIAALDLDHDGEISAAEIRRASESLRTLDRNKDGKLSPDELRPRPMGPGPDGPPRGEFDGPPPRGPGGPGGPGGPQGRGQGRGGPPRGGFGGPPPRGPGGPPDDGRPPVRPTRPEPPEGR